jgi:polyhydroxyalkanoate synthesis repressor PhaR
MPILIKRYANRKLYNTKSSRYITLKGIAELLDEGEEVRVVDNETGEDITSVALSQILVDNERSNTRPSQGLLSQIMERGGDVLYDALKKGMGDATDRIGELEDRFRRIVHVEDERSSGGGPEKSDETSRRDEHERKKLSDWIAYSSPDFDSMVEDAVKRVFRLLDLPRRSDVEDLNRNLERVASAVETLQQAFARHEARSAEDQVRPPATAATPPAPAPSPAPSTPRPGAEPAAGAAAEDLGDRQQSQ